MTKREGCDEGVWSGELRGVVPRAVMSPSSESGIVMLRVAVIAALSFA